MQTIATVQMYDVLDNIHISVQVRQQDNPESPWESAMLNYCAIKSTGELEPREWLRDSLIGLLELL